MLRTTLKLTISPEDAGKPIRFHLRDFGFSSHLLIQLKHREHSVFLNGSPAYLNTPLKEGDLLEVLLPEEESPEKLVPTEIPFGILYEDEDILVINKPSGMPIHPSRGNFENTLANAVAYYYEKLNEPFSYRCINRLDRDTTGALILARHALSACILSADMRSRNIHRTYLALAEGITDAEGTVDLPIGRKDASIIERCIDPENGERAVTHYKTLKTFQVETENGVKDCSLIELHLETGRTHQIRVHMHAIGHPLLGDSLYNDDEIAAPGRQALHSRSLEFVHPITKKAMQITAPLPDDFHSIITSD
ncbi:MAG: RluA family pseudouridine synthase [Lachnospiraceae bacterium]|nr:RluA family pseudouridine synthase [Lachnospiraceae bacterium]